MTLPQELRTATIRYTKTLQRLAVKYPTHQQTLLAFRADVAYTVVPVYRTCGGAYAWDVEQKKERPQGQEIYKRFAEINQKLSDQEREIDRLREDIRDLERERRS